MTLSPGRLGAVTTLGLHAVVIGALLAYAPTRSALFSAAPIMVDWIVAARPEPRVVEPPTERPKPKPVKVTPKPVEKPPVAVRPEEAPAPMAVPTPPPPPSVAAASAAPAVVAVTPPIFSADYLDNPAPDYPALSRRMHEEGRVILRVLVNPSGSADDVQVSTSSGHPRLDDSARETVRQWRFVPAKRGPQAVSAWVLIPISFGLKG
jgi:protein TonB